MGTLRQFLLTKRLDLRRKIQDANRDPSHHEVKERGENGKKTVTYEIEMRNGVEISRKEIASVTAKEPKAG